MREMTSTAVDNLVEETVSNGSIYAINWEVSISNFCWTSNCLAEIFVFSSKSPVKFRVTKAYFESGLENFLPHHVQFIIP